MKTLSLIAAASLLGAAAHAQELTYSHSGIAYSSQGDSDQEINALGKFGFTAGAFQYGATILSNIDLEYDDTYTSGTVWAGYNFNENLYAQLSYFTDEFDSNIGALVEYSFASTTIGLDVNTWIDDDWTNADLYVGHEMGNTFIAAEFRTGGNSFETESNLRFAAEYATDAFEVDVTAGFGLNDSDDYTAVAAFGQYNLNNNINLLGGMGAYSEYDYSYIVASLGAGYDFNSDVSVEAIVAKRFGESSSDDPIFGIALTWKTGKAGSVDQRISEIVSDTWNRVDAYD